MWRMFTVTVVFVAVLFGSQWRSTAQSNDTLTERVRVLEADVTELQNLVIPPAAGIRFDREGRFTDLSALHNDAEVHYSVCRIMDLANYLTESGFDSLPEIAQNPWSQRAQGQSGYAVLGCARVD